MGSVGPGVVILESPMLRTTAGSCAKNLNGNFQRFPHGFSPLWCGGPRLGGAQRRPGRVLAATGAPFSRRADERIAPPLDHEDGGETLISTGSKKFYPRTPGEKSIPRNPNRASKAPRMGDAGKF